MILKVKWSIVPNQSVFKKKSCMFWTLNQLNILYFSAETWRPYCATLEQAGKPIDNFINNLTDDSHDGNFSTTFWCCQKKIIKICNAKYFR